MSVFGGSGSLIASSSSGGRPIQGFFVLGFAGDHGLEMHAEIDRRVAERGQGRERNAQMLGSAPEIERHAEALVVNLQIPELMLQDDRHFVRILGAQFGRQPNAFRRCPERDVKMVVPRQPVPGGVQQRLMNDAPQGILDPLIIGQ